MSSFILYFVAKLLTGAGGHIFMKLSRHRMLLPANPKPLMVLSMSGGFVGIALLVVGFFRLGWWQPPLVFVMSGIFGRAA